MLYENEHRYLLAYHRPHQGKARTAVLDYQGQNHDHLLFDARPLAGTVLLERAWLLDAEQVPRNTPKHYERVVDREVVLDRKWLRGLTNARLRGLAVGMPYRHQCPKDELVDWLLQYQAAKVRTARLAEQEEDERVRTYDRHGTPHDDVLHTKTGRVLTDQELTELAEDAEQEEG
jgi:hypothetical protein